MILCGLKGSSILSPSSVAEREACLLKGVGYPQDEGIYGGRGVGGWPGKEDTLRGGRRPTGQRGPQLCIWGGYLGLCHSPRAIEAAKPEAPPSPTSPYRWDLSHS